MNAPVHHRNGGFQIRELHASAHPRGPHVKPFSPFPPPPPTLVLFAAFLASPRAPLLTSLVGGWLATASGFVGLGHWQFDRLQCVKQQFGSVHSVQWQFERLQPVEWQFDTLQSLE